VTQRRGRKYLIEEKATEIPVVLTLFDALYIEGKTLVDIPYLERRKILEKTVRETENIQITHPTITNKPEILNQLIEEAVTHHDPGADESRRIIRFHPDLMLYWDQIRSWVKHLDLYKMDGMENVQISWMATHKENFAKPLTSAGDAAAWALRHHKGR
jgi:hypothetical protein